MIGNLYPLFDCVVGTSFIILGIATLINIKSAQKFIRFVSSEESDPLVYVLVAVLLPYGLALVFSHNDWALGSSIFVTITGWILSIKCALWLTIPKYMRRIARNKLWLDARFLRGIGAAYTLIGIIVIYPYFIF